jgi:hypothetical protein
MVARSSEDRLAKELESIKKLLVLQLLDSGFKAGTLAEVIGMDPGDFSRMFPIKKLLKDKK